MRIRITGRGARRTAVVVTGLALLAGCGAGGTSGGQKLTAKEIIASATADPGTANAINTVRPCFPKSADPSTSSGQAIILVELAKEAKAAHAEPKGQRHLPMVTCATQKLELNSQQAGVFEPCMVQGAIDDVHVSHPVVTYIYVKFPQCYQNAKSGASAPPTGGSGSARSPSSTAKPTAKASPSASGGGTAAALGELSGRTGWATAA